MATLFLPVKRDCGKGEDRISELPDDILMSFVSTMGMKEAAKTSIVSKRWRYLWAKRTHLDFNPSIILPDLDVDLDVEYSCFPSRAIKKKYINWVNQVVDLHSSPCINTFRVCVGFERSNADDIEKWLRFAISKQVKNLELSCPILGKSLYTLTLDTLKPSLNVNVNGGGIRFLQSLCLKSINVSGDILEYVLEQCSFLERLHIERSQKLLVRLKLVGLCLKLKHLTISYCHLEQVEIEAVNLVYLEINSLRPHWSNVVLKNTPNLVDARFAWTCVSEFAPIFQQNSHLAQISKLSLHMQFGLLSAGSLPTFSNLKQLTMMVDDVYEDELIASINQFLKACPKLCVFKVEFTDLDDYSLYDEAPQLNEELDWSNSGDDDSRREYYEMCFEMEIERKGHPNIREFEVAGFLGCLRDVQLILFILFISCNLETITCDCSHGHRVAGEVTQVLKTRAAKLVKFISPKTTLAII